MCEFDTNLTINLISFNKSLHLTDLVRELWSPLQVQQNTTSQCQGGHSTTRPSSWNLDFQGLPVFLARCSTGIF